MVFSCDRYDVLVPISVKARKSIRITLFALLSVVVILLAGIAAIVIPILWHESAGSSGSTVSENFVSSATATGDDGRTREITVTRADGTPVDMAQLREGEELIVTGTGFDPDIGIYVSICNIPDEPGSKPYPCLGGVPEGATEGDAAASGQVLTSAWVTNNWAWKNFATHSYADTETGSFEVRLVVPPATQEGLNCITGACAITTRADHTATEDRVQDMQLRVAFAN